MRKEILNKAHSYYINGHSIVKIAKHFAVSASNLRQQLILNGYSMKFRKESNIKSTDEELVELYESGQTIKDLAFTYRVSPYIMEKRLSNALSKS